MFSTTPPTIDPDHPRKTASVDARRPGRARDRVTLTAVVIAAVTVDAASKVWVSSSLRGDPLRLGPLTLRLVHNRGLAFGVGAYLPPSALIAITAAVAVTIAVAGWRGRLDPPVAAGLIVGGAVANVADRLMAGSVVDFIDIGRWPVFNLADVILLSGIGLLKHTKQRPSAVDRPSTRPDGSAEVPGR